MKEEGIPLCVIKWLKFQQKENVAFDLVDHTEASFHRLHTLCIFLLNSYPCVGYLVGLKCESFLFYHSALKFMIYLHLPSGCAVVKLFIFVFRTELLFLPTKRLIENFKRRFNLIKSFYFTFPYLFKFAKNFVTIRNTSIWRQDTQKQ